MRGRGNKELSWWQRGLRDACGGYKIKERNPQKTPFTLISRRVYIGVFGETYIVIKIFMYNNYPLFSSRREGYKMTLSETKSNGKASVLWARSI